MANCTPTRRISRTNPITDLLRDRLAERESANETRLIEAQDAARAFTDEVSEVLRTYAFAPYEFGTLYADGRCIQVGMTVTNPANPSDRYLVLCNVETGTEEWQCYCPPGRKTPEQAAVMIAAVRARVAANRQARLGKAVN